MMLEEVAPVGVERSFLEGRGEFLIDPSRCWKEACF
jgi:hypothetical protein